MYVDTIETYSSYRELDLDLCRKIDETENQKKPDS